VLQVYELYVHTYQCTLLHCSEILGGAVERTVIRYLAWCTVILSGALV
jgi:hypothetical protein